MKCRVLGGKWCFHLIWLIVCVFVLFSAVTTQTWANGPEVSAEQDKVTLFDQIAEKARALAGKAYTPPKREQLPQSLRTLDYNRYQDIRFDKKQALWSGDADVLFNVEFFHLGFLYMEPVVIHEVVDGKVNTIEFNPAMFDYGGNQALAKEIGANLGFAGFRIHYPIRTLEYRDEILAFLGASYFRMVGRNQWYGISARGLALNTALPQGEEFPKFTEFWLVRPQPKASNMVLYALLESESTTGAYRFELYPSRDTVLNVEARLFARQDIAKLGIAPLTSMFLYGSNVVRHYDDYRPQVHDSDGLLVHTGHDEWIWRPLENPVQLRVCSLLDGGIKGFGLMQRERDFKQYLDLEFKYERRPSLWVVPQGNWGNGAVQLIEIPSKDETNDNIVAFWVPEKPFKSGEERVFKYQLRATEATPISEDLARVRRTRIGWGGNVGSKDQSPPALRKFIVDFYGGELTGLNASQPVEPELTISSGKVQDLMVQYVPEEQSWRVAFKLMPEGDKAVDMRLFIKLWDKQISETWNYVWSPDSIR